MIHRTLEPVLRRSRALGLPAILALAVAAPAAAEPPGAIAGRVREAATGRPVVGIEVRALRYGSEGLAAGRAITDAEGRYRIDGLASEPDLGPYLAWIEHGSAGYLGQLYDRVPCWGEIAFRERFSRYSCAGIDVVPTRIVLRPGRAVRGIDFELDRVGSISGTVTAAATGEPVGGVEIGLAPVEGFGARTVTDAAGRYRFGDLPPGDYRLTAEPVTALVSEVHPGVHCPYQGCFEVEGEPVRLPVGEHLAAVDFALEPLGGIAGRIADAGSGAALAGVAVAAYGLVPDSPGIVLLSGAVSDAAGDYRLAALQPGDYAVLAGDGVGPYIDQAWSGLPCVGLGDGLPCDFSLVDPVTVAVDATTENVDFELEIGGAIAGRVTGDGEPLGDLELWVRDGETRVIASPTTGADGLYEVEGLPAGGYTLESRRASERSFVDEIYDGVPCSFIGTCRRRRATLVQAVPGERVEGVDFTLERFGEIRGTLTAAATGTAIGFARVEIWQDNGFVVATLTDTAGRFASPPLARGSYHVSSGLGGPGLSWADEVYDGVLCPHGPWRSCSPDEGTPVVVRSGETTEGIDLSVEAAAGWTCTPSASGVCLDGGRFRAAAVWERGAASPRPLTDQAAAFTFGHPDNPEVAVRLIDACEPFGAFWVFAAGLTDRGVHLEVIDSETGESWSYFSPPDEPFPAVLDTRGLTVCGAPAGSGTAPASPPDPAASPPGSSPAGGSPGPCAPSPERLCLGGGRFAVEVEWDAPGAGGTARAVPLSDRAGWFWFFRPGAPELLVKVLDACGGDPPAHWVFAGGLTDLGVRMRVIDLEAGESREYVHPAGSPFVPILDTAAFASCP